MKKLILLFTFVAMCLFTVSAEYNDLYTFEKGKSLVGINVGAKLMNGNATTFAASYEYGLSKLFVDECNLGGGFFGGYYQNKLGEERKKIYVVGLRLNVHYQFIDRLDTYAGIDPNFNIKTYKLKDDKAKFACYFHIGGRYYLTNWLGVFAEMSTGFNNFSGGISVKF